MTSWDVGMYHICSVGAFKPLYTVVAILCEISIMLNKRTVNYLTV